MSYTCPANDETALFDPVHSMSSHSALNLSANCSIIQCQSNNYNCRNSQTPCFNYQTRDNISYCAPAIDCSILTNCNDSCSSNAFVCVTNTCCQPKGKCLPLFLTMFCQSIGKLS